MDLEQYQEWVEGKTSMESKDHTSMIVSLNRLDQLTDMDVNIPQLLTASVGLPAEAGEFTEIVKKIVFQGKALNEDNRFHMKRELGDLMFYFAMACSALGYTMQEVIDENVNKLDNRYKKGFTVEESENRKVGDL